MSWVSANADDEHRRAMARIPAGNAKSRGLRLNMNGLSRLFEARDGRRFARKDSYGPRQRHDAICDGG